MYFDFKKFRMLKLGALCGYSQITTLVLISYDRFVYYVVESLFGKVELE